MTAVMIVLSGLFFLPPCFPHTYQLVKIPMNWFQAQDYCRENYTDLATVDNDQDMARMTNLITMNSIQSVWFGLQTDTSINTWRWSLENQDYYGEGQAAFRMWNVDQPSYDPGLYKSCAAMLLNGHWGADDCESTFPFFCYNKNTSSFIYVNEPKTWDDAQSYCRGNYTDLASVRNQSENDLLKNMVITYTWIGLFRDSWKWSDGSSQSFVNWQYSKPSNFYAASCGAFNGNWVNSGCQYLRYFVCYTDMTVRKFVKVTLKKTKTSVDLESLKEDILKRRSRGNNKTLRLLKTDSFDHIEENDTAYNDFNGGEGWAVGLKGVSSYSVTSYWGDRGWEAHLVTGTGRCRDMAASPMSVCPRAAFTQNLEAQSPSGDIVLSWVMQPNGNVFHMPDKKQDDEI